MSDQKVRITRRGRKWSAWVGTTAELERIGNLMAKLMEQRRTLLLARYESKNPEPTPPDKPPAPDEPTEDYLRALNLYTLFNAKHHEAIAKIRRGRSDIEQGTSLQMSLTDSHSDEVRGPLEEVLSEFDRRTYRNISFSGSFPYSSRLEKLDLEMRRHGIDAGIHLEVRSLDPGWAKQALSDLSEEIDRGVPRSRFFRTLPGLAVFLVILWGLTYTTLNLLFTLIDWPTRRETAISVVIPTVAASFLFTLEQSKQWLFPAVEVVSEGEKPGGSRALIFIATLILTSVIGVAINTIK